MKTMTELSEKDLMAVNGGTFYSGVARNSEEDVTFVANIGDIVEVASGWGFGSTVRCKVVGRRITRYSYFNGGHTTGKHITLYFDEYKCVELESHWYFANGWKDRNDIEIPGT